MRQPKRFVIVGVILATALLSTGTASGLTGWQQFGNGAATGRGLWGYPALTVVSTTKLNPEALRFVVTAPTHPVQTSVDWQVNCWNGYENENLGASFNATPPITKVITELNVADYQYCALSVYVGAGERSALKLSLQAQYP
jgi:hypothetical protein